MLTALLALQVVTATAPADPFAFFTPTVTVTADERSRLARGDSIAQVLPGSDSEVAVLAAVPVAIDADRLVDWMRRIELLKKSSYVLEIGRFSSPPRIEDLAGLSLDDDDLDAIRSCRPGDCGLKLSADEMATLRAAAAKGGRDWKAALQQAFREAVLQRVRLYLATGDVPPYDDGSDQVRPAERFGRLLDHSTFLTERMPTFTAYLRDYPHVADSRVESFLYWSKERLAGKPNVNVTHVGIVRSEESGLPLVLVAGKEVFATHYVSASLGLTALLRGAPGGSDYLVYLNRSEVDILGGTFGGIVRWIMKRRLREDAAAVLEGLRHRLEGGEPPA